MFRRKLHRPSLKITRHADPCRAGNFTFEVWSPFTGHYQVVASIEDGMRRVDQLADLIYQMWLQRHPKQDALADAPDTDSTDTAKWGEFRINATTYRSYDTRWHDRPGWARATGLIQAAEKTCTRVGYCHAPAATLPRGSLCATAMCELLTAVYPVNDAAGDILSGSVTAPAGDSHVSLRLVSSSDDRVLSIRDHLLLLVHQDGELEVQRGPVRMVTWERAPWVIHHWTPFNELHPGEASSPGYRHAVERQHSTPDLPYGLEVWFGVKVLSPSYSSARREVLRVDNRLHSGRGGRLLGEPRFGPTDVSGVAGCESLG